jgi:hypothetical protein
LPNMYREELKDTLLISVLLVIRKLPSAQLASCVDLLCQLSPKWDEKCRKQGNVSLVLQSNSCTIHTFKKHTHFNI